MVAEVFLRANGYEMAAFDIKKAEEFILAAAQKQRSLGEIAAWLEQNSKPV